MRLKNLSSLKRPKPLIIELANLPQHILMTTYSKAKAFKISELVSMLFEKSFEWYGFTLADNNHPELITDIGLPKNDFNLQDYTTLGPQRIAEFQESLSEDVIINGWIHSHGALNYRHFSSTDESNHITVLDFVAARTRKALVKKEIVIQDLVLLEQNRFSKKDLEKGSVCLITNGPVAEAKILETIFGSFCYSIVIGDEGWHEQQIHFLEKGILSGHTSAWSKLADIELVETNKTLSRADILSLTEEVKQKIKPHTDPPPELIERM